MLFFIAVLYVFLRISWCPHQNEKEVNDGQQIGAPKNQVK